MGKAIGQRAAHHDNPGGLQFDREEPQSGDRRPTEEKAEGNGKNPDKHCRSGFFPKRGQVGLVGNGGAHKGGCPEREKDFLAESFHLVAFDT